MTREVLLPGVVPIGRVSRHWANRVAAYPVGTLPLLVRHNRARHSQTGRQGGNSGGADRTSACIGQDPAEAAPPGQVPARSGQRRA